jgi:hypothetical protein
MVKKQKIKEDLGVKEIEIIETEKEDEVKLRYRPFTALVIDNEKVEKVAKMLEKQTKTAKKKQSNTSH